MLRGQEQLTGWPPAGMTQLGISRGNKSRRREGKLAGDMCLGLPIFTKWSGPVQAEVCAVFACPSGSVHSALQGFLAVTRPLHLLHLSAELHQEHACARMCLYMCVTIQFRSGLSCDRL
eukprot:1158004-Pelagomonas_calceolata.AAC.8